ncbi:MAG: protein-glutamate O-methyltransferase CheR [Limisphaerales bacterium]
MKDVDRVPCPQSPPSTRACSRSEAADFDYLIKLVYERSRIRLHDGKEALIRSRLGKRMRHHGFETLGQYCDYLRRGGDEGEITHLIDALTTNFTNFLREERHFEFMVRQGIPGRLAQGQRKFRVWSAPCATGEEPYSIAMYLSEHFPPDQGWDWHILATDISTKALAKAQAGVYAADRVESLPDAWLRKYFQKGQRDWEGHFRVKPELSRRVEFRQVNLLGEYDVAGQFELIFCRNMMIYFDRPTQEQLVGKLCQSLVPAGHLLIGHSESLTGLQVPVRCLTPSIYQKM